MNGFGEEKTIGSSFEDSCEKLSDAQSFIDENHSVRLFQGILEDLLRYKIIIVNGKSEIEAIPLFIEGYIAKEKGEANNPCHCHKKQRNRYGCLYFHQGCHKGCDLVISKSDIYSSILLKCVEIDGERKSQAKFSEFLEAKGFGDDLSCEVRLIRNADEGIKASFCERIGVGESKCELACYRADLIEPRIYQPAYYYKRLKNK